MTTENQEVIAGFLPKVDPVTYQRNLIQQAVCELKFPTVYGLVRGKPPLELAKALRKTFPDHGTVDNLNVSMGGVAQDFAYVFKDKKNRTSITFRPSALSVETSSYQSFEALLNIVLFASESARRIIDSEFFTRVGLRYINGVPYNQADIGNWVNMELVSPLAKGSLGKPTEFSGRVATVTGNSGFLLQHGIGKKDGTNEEQYLLDFDVWREDVPFAELTNAIQELHEAESKLFNWSLGKAGFEYMGPGSAKVLRGQK